MSARRPASRLRGSAALLLVSSWAVLACGSDAAPSSGNNGGASTGGGSSGTAGGGAGSGLAGSSAAGAVAAIAGSAGSEPGSAGASNGGQGGATAGTSGAAGTGGAAGTAGVPAFDAAAVKAIMKRVADYEITRFGTGQSNGWVRAVFHAGSLAAARALGDPKYSNYTRAWGEANAWKLGPDSHNDARFADNEACVQSYAELYLAEPTAANQVRLAAAQTTFDAMVKAPKQGRIEWWWADSLFMAPGAFVRVAKAANKPQYVTLMNDMFWDTKAFLFDPKQSLFWRDKSYLNTNVYWSRGNGWVFAGIPRILDQLPATDTHRADYEALLAQMATKLASIQASDGFWRSSLTQPDAFKTKESSGTAFFCFGMAWGIHHGVLDRATYLPVVSKAWTALTSAVNAEGRLGWVQGVGQEPGNATEAGTNDYATGAFLLAGSELLAL